MSNTPNNHKTPNHKFFNFFKVKICNQKNLKNPRRAFGLINASIIISAVVIFSATTFAISEVNNKLKKQRDDKAKIEDIYKAMGRFLVRNKRLPCPARLDIAKGRDNFYGVEIGSGDSCVSSAGVYGFDPAFSPNANLLYGAVPALSLGLTSDYAEDQFGSKLVYIVDKRATYQSLATNTNIANLGTITGSSIIVRENGVDSTNNALFLILSNGKNKYRAFDAMGTTFRTQSSSVNEIDNSFSAIANNLVQMNNVFVASAHSDKVFDDYVFFKNKNDLIDNFSADFLVPCINAGEMFGFANASLGQVIYASVACPNDPFGKAIKKCGKNGQWLSVSSCRCYNNFQGVMPFYTQYGSGVVRCSVAPYAGGFQSYFCHDDGRLQITIPCSLQLIQ